MKTIYLAGGCFWGMQKFIDQFDGVISTEVGYANGPAKAPSYEEVCRSSGHAETVKVDYDENKIELTQLLRYYFAVIDPLSVNREMTGEFSTGPESIILRKGSCRRLRRCIGRKKRSTAPGLLSRWGRWRISIRRKSITRSIWIKIRAGTATYRRGS